MKKSAFDKLRNMPNRAQERDPDFLNQLIRNNQNMFMLSVSSIRPNPDQPRSKRNPKKFEELKNSIRDRGVLQPIRVLALEDGHQIIAGEGRWQACVDLEISEIPAVVVTGQSTQEAFIDALSENLVREDMNPLDKAEALTKLRVNLGLRSWDEVGNHPKIGLSRQQIYNLLGLQKLPEDVKADIQTGILNEKHGRALRTLLQIPELLETAHKHIKKQKLSGDDALTYVKGLTDNAKEMKLRVYKLEYRSPADLLVQLEAKVEELRSTLSQGISGPTNHHDATTA